MASVSGAGNQSQLQFSASCPFTVFSQQQQREEQFAAAGAGGVTRLLSGQLNLGSDPYLWRSAVRRTQREDRKQGGVGRGRPSQGRGQGTPHICLRRLQGCPRCTKDWLPLWSLHMSHETLSFCTMKIYAISGVLRPVWELKCSPSRDSPKVY